MKKEEEFTIPMKNKFFDYKGQWKDGTKHGIGELYMKDGSYYKGEFKDGEIEGAGERKYFNGSLYRGEFSEGERNGYGEITYANGEWYKGNWLLNIREGQGTFQTKDKITYSGEFRQNQPNGKCRIQFNDGSLYSGMVENSIMHGRGMLTRLDKIVYDGEFNRNLKHGEGKLYQQGGQYSFIGTFENDQPQFAANVVIFKLLAKELPPEEQKVESKPDPKAKKQVPDPKSKKKAAEEEDKDDGKPRIIFDAVREHFSVDFELHVLYQGPPFVDPNPPPVEETKKPPPKGKAKVVEQPEEPVIRMITPEPVLMTNESGRQFEFEIFQMEKVKMQNPNNPSEEIIEDVKKNFAFNQEKGQMKETFATQEGICKIINMKFQLTEEFKAGVYQIRAVDVTKGISNKMQDFKIEFVMKIPA